MNESENKLVLSIDIGNSYTKIGIISVDNLECLFKSTIPSSAISTDFSEILEFILIKVEAKHIFSTIISSVKSTALTEVERILEKKDINNVIKFEYHENLSVNINYTKPDTLGKDRIANLLYANKAYPGRNCIIICTGTAIVIDLLKGNGEFSGGSILPGLDMQFRALHEHTDALPLVNYSELVAIPGKSTEECIRAGVVHGTCGAIKNIVNQYNLILDEALILTSGGSWGRIAPFFNSQYIYIPDMTLIGTALFSS